MLIKFGIPVLAALALGFGIATTIILKPEQQLTDSPNPPANTSLGANTVAGLGNEVIDTERGLGYRLGVP